MDRTPPLPFAANRPREMPLDQALQLAGQHIDSGRLQQGEMILRQILKQRPKFPPALALLGVVAHHSGKTELGIRLIGEALEKMPLEAQYHSNLGEMCRIVGRVDEAIEHGQEAVKLRPNVAQYHSNLGIAYYDKKDYDQAEACQRRALQLNPKHVPALNNLGSIYRARNDRATAISYYRQVLEIAPDHHESLNNLGAVLIEEDNKVEEGIEYLKKAIRVRANYPDAHYNLANAHLLLGEEQQAAEEFGTAIKLRPKYADAYLGLARIDLVNELHPEALSKIQRALEIVPDKPEALALLGDVYTKMGFYDKAREAFDKAIAIDSDTPGPFVGKGHLLMELGHLDEAEQCFRAALSKTEDDTGIRLHLAQVRKVKADDENFQALVKAAENLEPSAKRKAMPLHFALGKCYDDIGEYDQAFPHFLKACRLKREQIQYDPKETERHRLAIQEYFDKATIDRLRGAGDPSTLPIFVLGMPRSGTTLVETILASHPEVYGAGELRDLHRIANNPLEGIETERYPFNLQYLSPEDLTRMGARYAAGLRERSPESARITDKMPANFLFIGLIHLILPNARIIHINRNPVDVCLSGFTRHFAAKNQPHSYDLSEMGHYYVQYARLMEHWRRVLPEDAFFEIQYEDLVSDPEPHIRRLIDYCGLEWNDACLKSHKTERSVKTASLTQVRQPVYTSSVLRWRHYEKFLGPLFEALGEYAPQRA